MKGFFVHGVFGWWNRQGPEFLVIQFPADSRTFKYSLYTIGKYKTRAVSPIEKCSKAHMVAATEQALLQVIPNGKGKLPLKKMGTPLAPFRISRYEDSIIASMPGSKLGFGHAEQLITIVQAHLAYDSEVIVKGPSGRGNPVG